MDIDQVNQTVALLHYEIYNQARREGKESVDAFRIAECFIQELKSKNQPLSLAYFSLSARSMSRFASRLAIL